MAPESKATCRHSARFSTGITLPPRLMSPRTTIWPWTGFCRMPGAQGDEARQGHGLGGPGVVQLDGVQVVVVIAGLGGAAHPADVGLEVVEGDLDRLLGRAA